MIKLDKSKKKLRRIIQTFISAIFVIILINNILFDMKISSVPPISLKSICPVGGVTSIYDFLFTGLSISIITISILIMSFLFGSVFCGWICPMGALQDLISTVTKKLHIKKYNRLIPNKLDKHLRLIRYIVLVLLVLLTNKTIAHYVQLFCVNNLITGLFKGYFALGGFMLIGLIFVVVAFFIERPWCKYLCPYGALLGLTNKIRIFKLRRNKNSCINCKKCDNRCPMNIKVSEKEIISDVQCISCFECTSENSCPIENTVTLGTDKNNKHKRIKLSVFAIVAIMTIFFSIAFSYYFSIKEWSPYQIEEDESYKSPINDIHSESEKKPLESGLKYNDGTYEGLAVGYKPGLKVQVTIENDKIIDIKITSHRETRGYYEEPFKIIPEQILERQSTEIDTISGATKSCNGIKKAVESALKKAEK